MRNQTFCICENKDADQLPSNCEAGQRLYFATPIVQFLCSLNPKFPDSSPLLCLYKPFCVGPVRKPHCRLIYAPYMVQRDASYMVQRDHPCKDQALKESSSVSYCLRFKSFCEFGLGILKLMSTWLIGQ